jgi:large subunit ribosomal protein L13
MVDRKTYQPKNAEVAPNRDWFVVDAEGKTLGRLATVIAHTLRGKHKPIYANHVDTGDFVIVVNADKVVLTGNKETQKIYYRHSQYPGGLKAISVKDQRKQHPDRIIKAAVRGMLPKNVLGEQQFKKLKVYAGGEHPHSGQQPKELAV